MDRISALRNVEDALREFEAGEVDLATAEERVLAVLRTYATEFEGADGDLAAYRATGDDRVDGVVVVAESPAAARDRVRKLFDGDTDGSLGPAGSGDPPDTTESGSTASRHFEVERLD